MVCCGYRRRAWSYTQVQQEEDANEENQTAVFASGAFSLSPQKVKCSRTPLPNTWVIRPHGEFLFSLTVSIYGKSVTLTDNGLELKNVGKSKPKPGWEKWASSLDPSAEPLILSQTGKPNTRAHSFSSISYSCLKAQGLIHDGSNPVPFNSTFDKSIPCFKSTFCNPVSCNSFL